MLDRLAEGAAPPALARAFHEALAAMFADAAIGVCGSMGFLPMSSAGVSPVSERPRRGHGQDGHAAHGPYGRATPEAVVLSGGCFLNRLLTGLVRDRLVAAGLSVYTHRRLSPGDACVSLGQAAIAAQRLRGGVLGENP
jgi:hypothetical protein